MGLETVELVMNIEDEFGIRVPDRDAEMIQTVGGLIAYVKNAREQQGLPIELAEVTLKVRHWISQLGVDASEIHDDAHLIFDLGLDARSDIIAARRRCRKTHRFDDVV